MNIDGNTRISFDTTRTTPTPGSDPAASKGKTIDTAAMALEFKLLSDNDDALPNELPEPPQPEDEAIHSTGKALNNTDISHTEADLFAVMGLITRCLQERRSMARETRGSAQALEAKVQDAAANEMRKAAKERFWGGMIAGGMQALGGAVQFGGALRSGYNNMNTYNNAMAQRPAIGSTGEKEWSKQFSVDMKMDDRALKYGEGFSAAASGVGKTAQAWFENKAAEHDAKKVELEAVSKAHDLSYQHSNDEKRQSEEMLSDLRQKLSAMEQSRNETYRAIARNI